MFPNLFLITLGAAVNGGRPWCSCIEGRAPTEALFHSQKISCNPIYFREMGDNNKTDRTLLLPPAKLMQPASHLSQKSKVTIFEAGNKCLFIRIMRKPPYFYKSISREITHSQKLGNMLSFFQCPKFCTLQLSMFVGVLLLIHWPHFYQNIPKWFWFHWMQNADATHESECWLTDLFWMI